ncbi:hypothetical protein [Aquibacillus saliphilus]|uniref:hypothetical protein n=1 Tax=Aquibacillus saliphilus TaxID=1909422 RepID=UPI001CF0C4DA|nr:hypothetical protein [Aquibacillus saliphilus]
MPRGKKKTHEEFLSDVYNKVGNEFIVVGNYQNMNTKIRMKHKSCQHKWIISPYNFLKSPTCPKCRVKSHQQFVKEVGDLVGREYTVIGEYKKYNEQVRMKHELCGNEWSPVPNNFLQGRRCPVCSLYNGNKKKTKTHEEFVAEVYDLVGKEYTVLSDYQGANKHVQLKHNYCNNNFPVTANGFLHDRRCPECDKLSRINKGNFEQKLFDKHGDKYKPVEEYTNSQDRIKFKHNTDDCGKIFKARPNRIILEGQTCPCQRTYSYGERRIMDFMDVNNQLYDTQYTFNDCRTSIALRFDLAVFSNQNNLMFLIEYDGEQHFKSVEYFGGEEGFKETKTRDQIKNTYCKDNDIPLIRIPYWEFNNIENILDSLILRKDNGVQGDSFFVQ